MSEQRGGSEPEVVPHEAGIPQDAAPPPDEPAEDPVPEGTVQPSVAPRTAGWREQSFGTAVSITVVAIWLIVSPAALDYSAGDASWNPIVCGVLIIVFSIGLLARPALARTLGLITFVIGAWLAASAFLLDAPPAGQLNQGGFGAIVAVLSLVGLAGAQRGRELNRE